MYLYSASGSLISTLTGSNASDTVGSAGITVLANGNFVVRSDGWNGSRGAVTWGSASGGVAGVVSASNSLIGGTASDGVGSSLTALSNGNYVVGSADWDATGPAVANVGAVTWGNGNGGSVGLVSAANSLVGGTLNDRVGTGVSPLSNGNYVAYSASWDSSGPDVGNVGAVTWGDGSGGTVGLVNAANSLVGGTASDNVGGGGVTALSNGNYVVRSLSWDATGPVMANVGAVTWGNGNGGTVGLVSTTNSLVGASAFDQIGVVTALSNGNYVVASAGWDATGPPVVDVGAVTWGDGNGGTVGQISVTNSLVGGSASDGIGGFGVTALSNGNYVARSANWDAVGPNVINAGAVTWGNGSGGTVGLISEANSLVGTTPSDQIGIAVIALSNGNYVVRSPNWDSTGPAVVDVGAVTWGDGSGGTVGPLSAANSLVGGSANDNLGGGGVAALSNGNYVLASPNWDATAPVMANVGAATWGNGNGGTVGLLSAANSLVGVSANDGVGSLGVVALANGNFVVRSANWNATGPAVANVGAVTWGNGSGGTSGLVSQSNSLVGVSTSDGVGGSGVFALSNGHYVVASGSWDATGPGVANVGAVTWGNGSGGTTGQVSVANSLVGGSANDFVGSPVIALSNGNYVVVSANWDAIAPMTLDSGAITRGIGSSATSGLISTSNSVLGTAASGGSTLVFAYDIVLEHLIVGRRSDNRVTIFSESTVPDPPTIGTALPGNAQVSIAFTAPADDGGSAITGYTASCGGQSNSGAGSPIVVTGLSNGTPVSCTVIASNSVGDSLPSAASNSVTPATVPDAPVIGTATPGNASASIAFAAPADDGGSAITGYTASCGGQSNSGAGSPIVVTGLSNGTPVSCTVIASNSVGDSLPSAASNSVTPATVPDAPVIGTATPGNASASIAFAAPADDGGSAITGYTGTCTPSGSMASSANSPIQIAGLGNDLIHSCSVIATNGLGDSVPSAAVTVIPSTGNSTDLSISKSNGVDYVSGGLPVSYLIQISNLGATGVASARVVDTLEPEFSAASWTCVGSNGGQCAPSGTGDINQLVDLPPGAGAMFVLTASLAALPETPVSNLVSLSLPVAITDTDLSNNVATDGPDIVGLFRNGFE